MSHIAIVLLRAVAPAMGVLLGLLGFSTLGSNLLGWLLFVGGVLYAAAAVIAAYVLKRNLWDANAAGIVPHIYGNERSFWLLSAGLAGVLYLCPLELLYTGKGGLPVAWLELAGLGLATLGGAVFLWARASRRPLTHGVAADRYKFPSTMGPYKAVRYPNYASCLLVCLGLVLGYASWSGGAALLLLLLPALLWRIRNEERYSSSQLGQAYREYASRTHRLIPGIW